MEQEIKVFPLNPERVYRLVKLHEDGRQEFKGIGEVYGNAVTVGVGVICANWFTTTVQYITPTGKGCIFETLNSTYLLEEFTDIKVEPDDAA